MLGSGGGSGGAGAVTEAVSGGLLRFVAVAFGPGGSEGLLVLFHLITDLDPILAMPGQTSENTIHVPNSHGLKGNTIQSVYLVSLAVLSVDVNPLMSLIIR